MPANECIPYKLPGRDLSAKATAIVNGKRFVKISGNRTGGGPGGLTSDLANVYQVAQAVLNDQAVGVSKHDAASGALVGVFAIGSGYSVPVTSGAAITAGVQVQSDANGKAITLAAGKPLGIALSTAGGADVDVEILLYG